MPANTGKPCSAALGRARSRRNFSQPELRRGRAKDGAFEPDVRKTRLQANAAIKHHGQSGEPANNIECLDSSCMAAGGGARVGHGPSGRYLLIKMLQYSSITLI